jgi:hypothetical protein
MKRATNFVYVIHAVGTNRVKIGFSDNPHRRLNDLQTGSPFPLTLVGLREGTMKTERAIHEYFEDRRIQGEWFEVEPDDALRLLFDDELIAGLIRPKTKKRPFRLNTMNDLCALDLSQILAKAVNSRMLKPEEAGDVLIFHVPMCPAHMMVSLPKCLMCIESESAELPTAA